VVERLARLIDVKSLVTLALVAVLCCMTIWGREANDLFNNSVMLVLGFFFGKNLKAEEKKASESVTDNNGSSVVVGSNTGADEAENSEKEDSEDSEN
jgi:hypothetical protein